MLTSRLLKAPRRTQAIYVNGVEFDGYDGFALVDAKGEGYSTFIEAQWSPEPDGEHGLIATCKNNRKDMTMKWRLSLRRRALGDPVSEGRRVWAWIETLKSLHPAMVLWRPTAESREAAQQAPPMTQPMLLDAITTAQTHSEFPYFGCTPCFCGRLGQGSKLMLSFGKPNSGDAAIVLMIGEELGAAIDASEDLADTLMHTTITHFAPATIGSLSRKGHPGRNINRDGPAPYNYSDGWKMFFTNNSPNTPRATQLATHTQPTANGTIYTFGTPDTYPTILNQW